MKTLKYILIGICLIVLTGVAPLLGGCVFLGILVLCGLEALGLFDSRKLSGNELCIIGGVIGALIFLVIYWVTGSE